MTYFIVANDVLEGTADTYVEARTKAERWSKEYVGRVFSVAEVLATVVTRMPDEPVTTWAGRP